MLMIIPPKKFAYSLLPGVSSLPSDKIDVSGNLSMLLFPAPLHLSKKSSGFGVDPIVGAHGLPLLNSCSLITMQTKN